MNRKITTTAKSKPYKSSNSGPRKRAWTPSEDDQLRSVRLNVDRNKFVQIECQVVMAGPIKWSAVADIIGTRNAKQCRERWHYQLNPEIKKGRWTAEEDALISALPHGEWARVAKALPGRTDMAIKNRYHTLTKRKCSAARKTKAEPKVAPGRAKKKARSSDPAYNCDSTGQSTARQQRSPSLSTGTDSHSHHVLPSPQREGAEAGFRTGQANPVTTTPVPDSDLSPSSGVARSTSSPELSALCDVAGVALDSSERPESCSPELLRVWARAAELGTPDPALAGESTGTDRSATISAVSALSALSNAPRLTPIAPCGGHLSSPELGAAFGVFDDSPASNAFHLGVSPRPRPDPRPALKPPALSPPPAHTDAGSPPRLPASGSHAAALLPFV